MAVKIRLSRIGKKNVSFCRIVAVDSRKKRDGAYLENLGTYDSTKGILVQFKEDRVGYWISQGAIPTDAVKKLIKLHKKQGQPSKIQASA
jgi:small subunit ribosomal protein S16